MDNAAYHAHPAVSKSHLDKIAKSPLHYWARYVDPHRVTPEPTPSMLLGSAVHSHTLELDKWDSEWAVAPAGLDRRTKAGKQAYADFLALSEGRSVITGEQYETVQKIGQSVFTHPAAAMLLQLDGEAETTHMWVDEATGLECKCRPDYLTSDGEMVIDLKTTRDASPRGFRSSAMSYRYHVQAAWYLHGLEKSTGKRPDTFIFIAVETEPPYCVGVYCADAELVAEGWRQAEADLVKLAACKSSGKWPSYSDEIQVLGLPSWMKSGTKTEQPFTDTIEGF